MRKAPVFLFLTLVFLASTALSLLTGGTALPLSEVLEALLHPHDEGLVHTLVWDLRLPRLVMAMLVGASLAACGAIYQAILRNPLAEPYTLGVSGGGALGATIAIVCGIAGPGMVLLCFTGCCLSMALVMGMAAARHFTNAMLILSGVIMSFLFSSLVMFIFAVASSREVHASILWLMGSLSAQDPAFVKALAALVIPLLLGLICFSRELNVLTLGDERARHLGLDPRRAKILFFLAASLITAACVSVSGVISFVGLLVPHLMRRLLGPNHRALLPACLLAGASLLMLSDALAQLVLRPLELPVGVITGILGGTFFLVLLIRTRSWEVM